MLSLAQPRYSPENPEAAVRGCRASSVFCGVARHGRISASLKKWNSDIEDKRRILRDNNILEYALFPFPYNHEGFKVSSDKLVLYVATNEK